MKFGIREVIFVLVLLAMPAASYLLVFEPRAEETAAGQAELERKQAKLQTLEEATAGIGDIRAEITKLEDAIAHFQDMLPNDREVETLLREVWDLAAEHDLTAKSVRPDKIVAAAQYAELPIRMVMLGGFDGFYSFVQDIEKLPRITRMPRITITKQRNVEEAEGVVQAELTLSIFFEGDALASR